MGTFRNKLYTLALLAGCLGTARAGVIFSENFDGATPGGYGSGSTIAGTTMQVTGSGIDVIGDRNGSFFNCPNPGSTNNNCVDLVGSNLGGLQTVNPLSLMSGRTYTITFDIAGSPNQDTPPLANYTGTVSLGSHTFNFAVPPADPFSVRSFQFVASSDGPETLAFAATNRDAAFGFWGAIVDNIEVTEDQPSSGVPEPSTFGLFGAAAATACAVRRWLRPLR